MKKRALVTLLVLFGALSAGFPSLILSHWYMLAMGSGAAIL